MTTCTFTDVAILTAGDVREVAGAAARVEVQAVAALFLVGDAVVALDEPVAAARMRHQHRVALTRTQAVYGV